MAACPRKPPIITWNKRYRKSKGQSRMNNPEKLATLSTQDEDKQNKKHNAKCVGHHYAQMYTNNVNKTWAFLQTTGGKDKPSIVYMRKS